MSKYTPKSPVIKSCAVCGKDFSASNPNYKYCSADCRKAFYETKQLEYQQRYLERHADEVKERRRTRRAENLEETREYHKEWMRYWREANGTESRAKARDYYERNAEERREYQREYRKRYKGRVAAQQAVREAVHRGDLPSAKTQVCVRCGNQATEYHHWSYEREDWLKVEAMCPTCHARADRERIKTE